MFPLQTATLPPTADALRAALEKSLGQLLRPAGGRMVAVEDKDYPDLAAIRISLDGANASKTQPRQSLSSVGGTGPGLRVAHFEISGRPIFVGGAKVNISCTARDVQLSQGRDKEGNVLLLLQDAAEGNLEVRVPPSDLEALVLAGAKAAASKQGVMVENVRIELRSRSERALDVIVHVRAKKLFLTAAVRIIGSVAIDEQLNARLSGLECAGDGALAALACEFIAPHLAQIDGREFSLMALPLGELKLRDVRIATGNELRITAEFGRA